MDISEIEESYETNQDVSLLNVNTGKLKIFLGYCAGIGKTYRMLQEGIATKRNGSDVVIGIVETHSRAETELLVRELNVAPRKSIEYSGIKLDEMDIDYLLERCPQYVLVDELAHSNIPGSRHSKRYQDIEELLNAGINVLTTLNIQHIQGLVDIIYQITGVKVDETIPNHFIDSANQIELVDLPPEKLQQRFAEGKVYIPQKAKVATQKFFKTGNLLALRELSLKYTAKQVDIDLLLYRKQQEIADVWPIESKILVGISSHKNTERTILIAHRMAADLGADWYAVHVESIQQVRLTQKARNQLYRNINLAEELGAKVVTLSGSNIADEVIKFAKQKNITLIITGLSQRSRLQEIIKGSVINKIVKNANPINVLVVGSNPQPSLPSKPEPAKPLNKKPFLLSALGISIVFGLSWLFPKWILAHNLLMILLLPSIISGILWGIPTGLFTTIISLGLYDLFFIPPISSFVIADPLYLSNMVLFILIVIGTSWIGRMIRWRADSARHRERFVYALYNFSREIIGADTFDETLNRAMRSTTEAFESEVLILLPINSQKLVATIKSKENLTLNEMELAVATWVYKNKRHAGKGTRTLSSTDWYYIPIKTKDDIVGVMCLIQPNSDQDFSPEQRRLLEAFAGIIALALTKTKK